MTLASFEVEGILGCWENQCWVWEWCSVEKSVPLACPFHSLIMYVTLCTILFAR